MAGFLAALGGAGNAAAEYGHQIRGMLESRRHDLVNLATQIAPQIIDPEMKGQVLQFGADAARGKDLALITPKLLGVLQKHHENSQALGNAAPPQAIPQLQKPEPRPANPGEVGGAPPPEPAPAAQTTANPVLPTGQPIGANAQPVAPAIPPVAQTSAPAIPPMTGGELTPQEQSLMDIYNRSIQSGWAPAPTIEQAVQPIFQHVAALRQEQALRNMDLQERQGALKELKNSPEWENYPDIMKGQFTLWAHSRSAPLPSLPSALMKPFNYPGVMPAQSVPDNERFDQNNNPISKDVGYVRQVADLMTGRTYYRPATGAEITVEQGGHLTNVPRVPGKIEGVAGGGDVHPSSFMNARPFTDVSGKQFFQSPSSTGLGQPISGALNPGFAPRTSQSLRSVSTMDPNGNPVTELVPVTTKSQKGTGPGASIPPMGASKSPGPQSFPKPFTPEQQLKNTQQLGQYNLAIDRAQYVRDNIHMLESMIDAGKLNLQIDPTQGVLVAAVNRNVPLTDAEAKFAGAFQTLKEDINLLRGPLGATGFRGPEAFAALQAQRGQLLANPKVTKEVLENTLKAMKVQRDGLQNAVSGRGQSTIPPIESNAPKVQKWGRDAQGNPIPIQ